MSLDEAAGPGAQNAPILLVEDDLRLRQMIRWALEAEGFVVELASDGRRALELAARSRPALIVLDHMLPLLDGTGVADGLRELYGEPPPIVLITADGQAEEKARRTQARAFLAKPFEVDDLLRLVRQNVEAA